MLHPVIVLSIVLRAISPKFTALTMLLVVEPHSVVSCAIQVRVNSLPISFVVTPFTFVDISIGVPKLAFSIGFVVSPLSLILGAIRPPLNADSLSLIASNVAFVDSAVLELHLLHKVETSILSLLFELAQLGEFLKVTDVCGRRCDSKIVFGQLFISVVADCDGMLGILLLTGVKLTLTYVGLLDLVDHDLLLV